MIEDFDFIVDKQMKLNKTKTIKFNLNSNKTDIKTLIEFIIY